MSDVNLLIGRITSELDTLKSSIERINSLISSDTSSTKIKIALLEKSLEDIEEEIRDTSSSIEKDLRSLKEEITRDLFSLKSKLDAITSSYSSQNTEDIKGKWTLYSGIATALISLVGILITTIGPVIAERVTPLSTPPSSPSTR